LDETRRETVEIPISSGLTGIEVCSTYSPVALSGITPPNVSPWYSDRLDHITKIGDVVEQEAVWYQVVQGRDGFTPSEPETFINGNTIWLKLQGVHTLKPNC
jgi:hypothetical protein